MNDTRLYGQPDVLPAAGSWPRFVVDLNLLGWDSWRLVNRLDLKTDRAARRWISGHDDPPAAIVAWVGKIADFVRANPPPGPPAPRITIGSRVVLIVPPPDGYRVAGQPCRGPAAGAIGTVVGKDDDLYRVSFRHEGDYFLTRDSIEETP